MESAVDGLGKADGAVRTAAALMIAAEDVVGGAGTVGDRLADHELAEPVTDTDNHRFVVLVQHQSLYAPYAKKCCRFDGDGATKGRRFVVAVGEIASESQNRCLRRHGLPR